MAFDSRMYQLRYESISSHTDASSLCVCVYEAAREQGNVTDLPQPPAASTGLDTEYEMKKPKQTNLESISPLCFYCFCQSCLPTNPLNLENFRDQVPGKHRF